MGAKLSVYTKKIINLRKKIVKYSRNQSCYHGKYSHWNQYFKNLRYALFHFLTIKSNHQLYLLTSPEIGSTSCGWNSWRTFIIQPSIVGVVQPYHGCIDNCARQPKRQQRNLVEYWFWSNCGYIIGETHSFIPTFPRDSHFGP